GALFGDVTGAAVRGATEPLVRRAADWAARRAERGAAEAGGSPESDGTAAEGGGTGPVADVPVSAVVGGPRPVALADLVALTAQIADLCGVQDRLDPRVVRVRSMLVHRPRDEQKSTAAQPFLNSLLPPDLARVRDALPEGPGPALEGYLTTRQSIDPEARTDLRHDRRNVLAGVAPRWVPAGRWPAKAQHPLALSQQFAVNRVLADLAGSAGGLFSVNGPPGTGKTTMLRDLVAALVVERAAVMAAFDRPEQAFTGRAWQGNDRQGRHKRFVAKLDPRLTGFEIVVTSSNNGAVENVTAELPGADALDEHWRDGTDHFSDLASALLGGAPAWGLVAAVLGNKGNRREFGERFWWGRLPEKESKARSAAGLPRLRGMQSILSDWVPPRSPGRGGRAAGAAGASAGTAPPVGSASPVPSWAGAVAAFRAAQAEVDRLRAERVRLDAALSEVESGRAARRIEALRAAGRRADEGVAAADARHGAAATAVAAAGVTARAAEVDRRTADALVPSARQELATTRARVSAARELAAQRRQYVEALTARHQAPVVVERGLRGGLRRLLRTSAEREAAEQQRERSQVEVAAALMQERAALDTAMMQVSACVEAEAMAVDVHVRCSAERDAATTAAATALAREEAARAEESAAREATGRARREAVTARRDLDAALSAFDAQRTGLREAADDLPSLPLDWLALPDGAQELSSPWSDEAWATARSDLFLRALDLHRALVAGNALRVRGNLQVLMESMAGTGGPVPDEEVLRAWQTLFLLVPVVSTTFSSIGSMFARLGQGSIGWVLVDEAGQATPQAAVGALWRAKRAVLVGDPLQLEPVVTMPSALQRRLLRAYGVDEEWLPSATSAQAVADRVNRYGTYLPGPAGGDDDHVWVGSPLRVHRRCEEPMFTVSNEVAYDGLMVYGTGGRPFPDEARDGLLPSRWLNTDDPARPADAAWGERDRRAFAFVLDHLDREGVEVDRLRVIAPFRALVRECQKVCGERPGWTRALLAERCATVHKAQGKEADVVVLVLGGNRPGARSWAARTPHLLNVAASRAKRRLYVIGERDLWAPLPHFDVLAAQVVEFDHVRDRAGWPPLHDPR
ncbi:AAA domain-containing protein, partial [Streptomyces sp. NPDC005955]|uniref:AAA domain-containing protein n=1 Tax=Streptomyces sp. NPDC005955 TaxID=3364738 RepID=UPI0036CA431B